MIKKLAGAAVGTLLITSIVMGTSGIAAAVGNAPEQAAAPTSPAAVTPVAEPGPDDYTAYLFVHFVDTEEDATKEQIYFSVSENGTDWTTLNNSKPILSSTVGEKGVRDPHIIRTQDDKFVIIATDLSIANRKGDWGKAQTGGSQNIVIWQSDTIDGWTGGGTLTHVGTPDALDVWAPESIWDVDKNQYMVTWASIVGDPDTDTCYDWHYRIYRSYTTDFVNFTEPEVYIEQEGNVIDTTFYYNEANQTYYRFTKDESNKWVFMEQGQHLDGAFEKVATYKLDGQHYSKTTGVEGPTVYKDNTDDKWYLLLDNWTYRPYETEDITKGVFTQAGEFTFNGPRFRHGSVLPIKQSEYEALLAKYPVPEPADPDKTTGELIFELGFENDNYKVTTGTEYTVTPSGNFTYEQGSKSGTQAARFSWDAKTSLKLDSKLLAGRTNATLHFVLRINNTAKTSWFFFAAQNDKQMSDPPTYIGTFFKDGGTIASERFLGGRPDDSYNTGIPGNEWLYVTVVYYHGSTKLFFGTTLQTGEKQRSVTNSTASLADILGSTPSIYLGKSTWGNDGEYAEISLEKFRVYDYAMPDSAITSMVVQEML